MSFDLPGPDPSIFVRIRILSTSSKKIIKKNLDFYCLLKPSSKFRYDFTESQAASFRNLQCQNRRFKVFEVGRWQV
jgi:hypothetical protein